MWLQFRSRWATPEWLDSLPDEHKRIVATGPFPRQLRNIAAAKVSPISWVAVPEQGAPVLHNGSMFFLDCGDGPFAVTAGHVCREYLRDRSSARRVICQVGNLDFDPQARLIGQRDQPDIATFRITRADLRIIGKEAVVHDKDHWPPSPLHPGQAVIVAGFPGQERLVRLRKDFTPREINFGLYYCNTLVTTVVHDQLTCRFERVNWVDSFGHGVPDAGYDLGGISGAPLLRPTYLNKRWVMQLAGVITEAHCDQHWEQVTAATAVFLLSDGQIQQQV